MKTQFWYCPTDNYGQRTGHVESLTLTKEETTTDKYGNEVDKLGRFLYRDKRQALRAAHN